MIATIQKTEGGQIIQNLLTTNEQAYIEHFVSIFEDYGEMEWMSNIKLKILNKEQILKA
jgi:hypothetical protein